MTPHDDRAARARSAAAAPAPLPWARLPWGALGWACAALAFGVATARLDPNVLEEGIIVHAAERLLGGERLYRDVIVHTAPLPYELLALGFRIFGAELWVARALLVAFHAAATAATFALVRRCAAPLAPPCAAIVATAPVFLFPQLSSYYYTTLAFYLTLVAAWLGVRAARPGSGSRPGIGASASAVAAGAVLSAIALCKQTTGVAFAGAFVVAIAAAAEPGTRARRAVEVVCGAVGIAALTLAVYALRGGLAALWFGVVELPLSIGGTFRAPVLNWWPPGELEPAVRENWAMYFPSLYYLRYGLFAQVGPAITVVTQALYALPFVAIAASAVRALRGGLVPAGWLHGAVLIAMTLNLFPRSSWGHLVVALPPALVQLALIVRRADRAPAPRTRALGAAAAAAIGAAALATAAWIGAQAGPATFGPRVPLRPVSESYKQPAIPRVIHYLLGHTRPGDPIFVARQEPLLYFATRTRNPTPFGGVLPGLPELQEPIILAALPDVRYVVVSDIDQPLYTYYSDELPRVWAHLERHYRIPADFPIDDYSWIVVVARGADRGAVRIDLHAQRDRARTWLRDRDGSIRDDVARPQRLAARQLNRPLPVALGPRGGGIDFEIDVPPRAVFLAGYGFRGLVSVDHQYIHPSGVTLSVEIDAGSGFETLWSARVDDGPRAGRRWSPIEIDLARWAGRRVTLRLNADTEQLRGPDRLTWWGSPRIAVRGGS